MRPSQQGSITPRSPRRAALRTGGLGFAAAIAAGWLGHAEAQSEPPDDAGPGLLFVQSFTRGALTPHPDDPATATLTLTQSAHSTLYFADRPAREAGVLPTSAFLDMLGVAVAAADPPNAALVPDSADGASGGAAGGIWVVTLLRGSYDAAAGILAYDVRFVDPASTGVARFAVSPARSPGVPQALDAGHLFIDPLGSQGGPNQFHIGNRTNRGIHVVIR